MSKFFDAALQDLLVRRFDTHLDIVKTKPVKEKQAIYHYPLWSGGDTYGGDSTGYGIVLGSFSFELRLQYVVHELSRQIDDWHVEATNVPEDLIEEIVNLADDSRYPDHYLRNPNMSKSLIINGVRR